MSRYRGDGITPCLCGCGKIPKYGIYISGHNSWQNKIFKINNIEYRKCLECERILSLNENFSPSGGKEKIIIRARCKDCIRLKRYGITFDQLQSLYDSQNGLCAICHEGKTLREIYIDHSYKTGKVRGLLYNICNSAIGMLGEDLERFYRAMRYIGIL